MQRFCRPPQPPEFEAAVEQCREEVRKHFSKRASAAKVSKIDFKDKWKEYKDHFSKAQFGKCGYCEIRVIGGQFGDVEHFYPKGEVWELQDAPEALGAETMYLSTVTGRKRTVLSEQGYWWLAYDWSNYLLSCMVCNQVWKLSFFPVNNQPRRTPPRRKYKEHILLLNPFDEHRDPAEHLDFDQLGQVRPRDGSIYGKETIRVCGLDREGLRTSRKEKAMRAYYLVGVLLDSPDPERLIEALKEFRTMGHDENIHSGMVRSIFTRFSGMAWSDIDEILSSYENARVNQQ